MNIIRRIAVVLFAFILFLGALMLFLEFEDSADIPLLSDAAQTIVIFSLPVLLSTLFSPRPKKYSALVALIVEMGFICTVSYRSNIPFPGQSKQQESFHFSVYTEFPMLIGLLAAFGASYLIFKNKGWKN